jgi:hypothetical protein
VMAQAYNPSILEAEAGGWVWDQRGLLADPSQKNTTIIK